MEKETVIKAIDILERFDFFQGQRAGRELWNKKTVEVQEEDLETFSRDVTWLIDFIKELTEKVESYRQELGKVRVALNNANVDNKRLTEENERLSTALANYDRQTEVRIAEEYYTAEAYDELREENERLTGICESYALQYGTATVKEVFLKRERADTVREFAERFKELMGNEYTSCGFCNAEGYWSVKAVKDNIDRIANEILNKNTEE